MPLPPDTSAPGPVDESLIAYFVELGAYERHFNEMQARYRALASTWLLATFAGVGFIVSQDKFEILPVEIAVIAIALAGASGIGLLWNLDLMVYHQLLDAVFAAGLQLEYSHPRLPSLRRNMVRATASKGVLPRVIWFYLGTIAVLLLLAAAGFVVWLRDGLTAAKVVASLVVAVVASVALVRIYKRTCVAPHLTHDVRQSGEPPTDHH
jgi:hypothetical protein